MKQIVVASDSYKGSLSTIQVANAIARGIRRVYPDALIKSFPVADGGEGTLDSILSAGGGERITVPVHDPLGRIVQADYGILKAGTAMIEMATASGLTRLSQDERNPMIATTYGTGELMMDALSRGCREFYIGIGGSATNDGGAGMAQALGVRCLDVNGNELPQGGAALKRLHRIDLSGIDPRIAESRFTVLSDVDNPLCGTRGASVVYGPQKGATKAMTFELDRALHQFGKIITRDLGIDVAEKAGAGAAGGLGAGLMAFCGAALMQGVSAVLSLLDIEQAMKSCHLVITGEGQMDYQTAFGKAPVGIAKVAKQFQRPVVAIVGGLGEGYKKVFECGIDAVFSIVDKPMTLDEAMLNSADLVADCAENVMRLYQLSEIF
ncbi:glycerate kinase [Fusibacter paucivorans]|uniref:Glycerate kinase n=1 Tax=Fusibacter paucivorans TaxID=76009 RepID=A0ABS5PK04_9FIRM|nr:glycerate kinase [Fusibacter paucivorans]MBS7525473.1 glycerate kinase [Fusibacter paucivorans]